MDNFIFHNPTRLIFGKGMIAQLSQQIPADKRIMITFGGGSVKTNGVYEQVIQALEGRDYTEFWGIESNPDISTLKKAIESGKEKNIDFLLAVGGGSVIDGTKLISAGIPYDGDAWELVKKGSAQNTIPLGTVLTIPATGSEMNNGAVISCRETHEKYPFFSSHPVFSILDPTVTFSLPDYQIACGLAGIIWCWMAGPAFPATIWPACCCVLTRTRSRWCLPTRSAPKSFTPHPCAMCPVWSVRIWTATASWRSPPSRTKRAC